MNVEHCFISVNFSLFVTHLYKALMVFVGIDFIISFKKTPKTQINLMYRYMCDKNDKLMDTLLLLLLYIS